MPPKKIGIGTVKVTNEQKRRGRKKKIDVDKPKLRTPTIIKVKIPPVKSFLSSRKKPKIGNEKGNQSPKISPAVKRKIDLANEVALAQLTNTKIEDTAPVIKKKKKEEKVNNAPSKRGRPKTKSLSLMKKEENPVETPPAMAEDPPTRKTHVKQKKITLRRGVIKKVDEKMDTEIGTKSNAPSKRKADSTSQSQARRKSGRINANVNETVTPQIVENKPEKSTIASKGKLKDSDGVSTTDQHSPSILEEASKLLENNKFEKEISNPSLIDSRKTSTSECLSWTRDISLSSTTTCLTVGSNDIVRFDKKLPVIKLSNIDKEWDKIREERREQCDISDSESNGSSSSCSSSSSSSSSSCLSTSVSRSLNLSSPSIPPDNTPQTNEESQQSTDTKDENWKYALQELPSILEKFDLEFTSWVGYENQNIETEINTVQDKILKLLTFEQEVLKDCKNIKDHFRRRKNFANVIVAHNESANKITQNNIEANNYVDKSEDDDNFTSFRSKFVMLNQNCEREQDSLRAPTDKRSPEDDNLHLERDRYTSFDEPYIDDDDALSLFAESITGIESSKFNSSANSMCANASDYEHEEYVPQPMMSRDKLPETRYVPTKITDINDQTTQNNKPKTICEKQNADSTSIHKETESHSAQAMERIVTEQNGPIQHTSFQTTTCSLNITIPPPTVRKKPFLLSCLHKPMAGVKSVVFRGVCFYNLISNCKKVRCLFPHIRLDKAAVSIRLANLNDQTFIQEYMLLRGWPDIRRLYGFCYVTECANRKLTRVLVEMAIDFICKTKLDSPEDANLQANVIERTLLYLNNVDLSTCEDLLRYEICSGVFLCNVFMQTIAETQNFSRFKVVFTKLTDFITEIGETFRLDVANHILERVCILPCEEPLVRAVMKMIRKTDPKIFENPMMSQFEKHLTALDMALCEELYSLRQMACVARPETVVEMVLSPQLNGEEEPMTLMRPISEERYTSPDTTKMDHAQNKAAETPIKQTVQIVRPPNLSNRNFFPFQSQSNPNSPVMNEGGENRSPNKYRPWRGHHNFLTPNMPMFNRLHRPLLKRRMDQRQVAFGLTPPKFPRRSGPDYF